MTSLPAHRRDFARQPSSDEESSTGTEVVLPDLPMPGPAARDVLALFESPSPGLQIVVAPGRLLH